MRFINLVLGLCAVTFAAIAPVASQATAQIEVDQLNPASAFDSGILDSSQGGLDSALWQGTTAARAVSLISNIGPDHSPEARQLVRAALLSAGVPPQAEDGLDREAYIAARFSAVLASGDTAAFDELASRNNLNPNDSAYNKIFVERALLAGHTDRACSITDGIMTERKAPYWAKIRAYCHYVRGEVPAAELTADILRRNAHEDDAFFALIGGLTGSSIRKPDLANLKDALHIGMARDYMSDNPKKSYSVDKMPAALAADIALSTEVQSWDRMAALKASAHVLSPEQVGNILAGLSDEPLGSIDELTGTKSWTSAQWGQAVSALRTSTDINTSATLASEIFTRAETIGLLDHVARAFAPDIAIIPTGFQGTENAAIFARVAVINNDLSTLGGLFQTLSEDDPLRGRIALASDALGGGFLQAPLGVDIETRLVMSGNSQKRAIRDTFIATALGSTLPDRAADALMDTKSLDRQAVPAGALLALKAAARRGSKAETVLLAAQILGPKSVSDLRDADLAAILFAFTEAGLYQTAGRLAAVDFISGTN